MTAPRGRRPVLRGSPDPKTAADQFIEQFSDLQDKIEATEALIAELNRALPPLRESLAARLEASETKLRVLGGGTGQSHMYPETQTWNPFVGCEFDCTYCKPSFKAQAKRQRKNCPICYDYTPHCHPDRLEKIPTEEIVFACGCGDISFCDPAFIERIIEAICGCKPEKVQAFYLQSKQPECLQPHLKSLPPSVIVVTTLETNRDDGYDLVSKAPPPSERFKQFLALEYPRKVVTIEPVMDFDVDEFVNWIVRINPKYVWLGYNSREKQVKLPEPSPEKLLTFVEKLIEAGIEVRGKHLRGIELPGVTCQKI
jgi:hypothetical protein